MGFFSMFSRKPAPEPQKQTARRSYSGAKLGRLTASWTTQPKPADGDIRQGLRVLRARSRELAQNNDYAVRFLKVLRSNVIGPKGIVYQARAKDGDRLDQTANQALELAWTEWGKYGSPDVTGCHSWRSIQELYVSTLARDGEVLIIRHNNWRRNRFRYALEFVDVEALDVELNQDLGSGRSIRMGIEFDRYRRPVAYYLLTPNAAQDCYTYGAKKYTRVAAENVIHRFLPESAWQSRGVPWTASTLVRMNMLGGYEEAELVAARVASAKMGFFETEGGGEYVGEGEDENGDIITEAEPGTFETLPEGVKFSSWDPSHPNGAYSDFVKSCLRGVASGLGLSYHTLANDLEGVNYSSARVGAQEDRELFKGLQEWIVESFVDLVFQEWLENALLSGIQLPNGGTLSPQKIAKYRAASWQPRRWAWVDPQKEMNAAIMAVDNRIRSVSDVIREQGKDPEEVWTEIAAERRRMEELEITPASAGFFMPDETAEGADDA